jgi:hypothetical protein
MAQIAEQMQYVAMLLVTVACGMARDRAAGISTVLDAAAGMSRYRVPRRCGARDAAALFARLLADRLEQVPDAALDPYLPLVRHALCHPAVDPVPLLAMIRRHIVAVVVRTDARGVPHPLASSWPHGARVLSVLLPLPNHFPGCGLGGDDDFGHSGVGVGVGAGSDRRVPPSAADTVTTTAGGVAAADTGLSITARCRCGRRARVAAAECQRRYRHHDLPRLLPLLPACLRLLARFHGDLEIRDRASTALGALRMGWGAAAGDDTAAAASAAGLGAGAGTVGGLVNHVSAYGAGAPGLPRGNAVGGAHGAPYSSAAAARTAAASSRGGHLQSGGVSGDARGAMSAIRGVTMTVLRAAPSAPLPLSPPRPAEDAATPGDDAAAPDETSGGAATAADTTAAGPQAPDPQTAVDNTRSPFSPATAPGALAMVFTNARSAEDLTYPTVYDLRAATPVPTFISAYLCEGGVAGGTEGGGDLDDDGCEPDDDGGHHQHPSYRSEYGGTPAATRKAGRDDAASHWDARSVAPSSSGTHRTYATARPPGARQAMSVYGRATAGNHHGPATAQGRGSSSLTSSSRLVLPAILPDIDARAPLLAAYLRQMCGTCHILTVEATVSYRSGVCVGEAVSFFFFFFFFCLSFPIVFI